MASHAAQTVFQQHVAQNQFQQTVGQPPALVGLLLNPFALALLAAFVSAILVLTLRPTFVQTPRQTKIAREQVDLVKVGLLSAGVFVAVLLGGYALNAFTKRPNASVSRA